MLLVLLYLAIEFANGIWVYFVVKIWYILDVWQCNVRFGSSILFENIFFFGGGNSQWKHLISKQNYHDNNWIVLKNSASKEENVLQMCIYALDGSNYSRTHDALCHFQFAMIFQALGFRFIRVFLFIFHLRRRCRLLFFFLFASLLQFVQCTKWNGICVTASVPTNDVVVDVDNIDFQEIVWRTWGNSVHKWEKKAFLFPAANSF